jgi:hypothetical protein
LEGHEEELRQLATAARDGPVAELDPHAAYNYIYPPIALWRGAAGRANPWHISGWGLRVREELGGSRESEPLRKSVSVFSVTHVERFVEQGQVPGGEVAR